MSDIEEEEHSEPEKIENKENSKGITKEEEDLLNGRHAPQRKMKLKAVQVIRDATSRKHHHSE